MTFSKLATGDVLPLGFYHSGGRRYRRYMARNGSRITAITNHGIVGDVDSLRRELMKTSRTLSVNYGVSSEGVIHGCVAEEYKANTTSHASDHHSITLEIANDPRYPHPMTDAAFRAAAKLNADICRRYGITPSSSTINFHREYVATQCPGDHTWARRNEFIALVQKYLAEMEGKPSKPAPKPPQPAPSKPPTGSAKLNGVGINDVVRISNWALYNDPALRTGERFVTGDYTITGITYRYRGGEPVLHLRDSRGGKAWAHYSAVRGVLDGKPSKPAPKPKSKSIGQMASEVIAGKHGNGHTNRQRSLGVNAATYAKVRAEVNRRI